MCAVIRDLTDTGSDRLLKCRFLQATMSMRTVIQWKPPATSTRRPFWQATCSLASLKKPWENNVRGFGNENLKAEALERSPLNEASL